jgi:hypothetical protein
LDHRLRQAACATQARNVQAAGLDVADAFETVKEMSQMQHIAETLKTLRRLQEQYRPAVAARSAPPPGTASTAVKS